MFTTIYGLLIGDLPAWARIFGYVMLCLQILGIIYVLYRLIKSGKLDVKDIIKYLIDPNNKQQVIGFISDIKDTIKSGEKPASLDDEEIEDDEGLDELPADPASFVETTTAVTEEAPRPMVKEETDKGVSDEPVIDVVEDEDIHKVVKDLKQWVMDYVRNRGKGE